MTILDNKGKFMSITDLDKAIAQANQMSGYGDRSIDWQKELIEYWEDVLAKLMKLKNINTPCNGALFFNEYGSECVVVAQDTLGRGLVYCQKVSDSQILTEEEVHQRLKDDQYTSAVFALWDIDYKNLTFIKK